MRVSRMLTLGAALLPLAAFSLLAWRSRPARTVAQANTGEAVEAPAPGLHPSAEALLDAAVEYTFPASDPVSVQSAYRRLSAAPPA